MIISIKGVVWNLLLWCVYYILRSDDIITWKRYALLTRWCPSRRVRNVDLLAGDILAPQWRHCQGVFWLHQCALTTLIARFMGPTWGPPGADRTQVGPMLAPWTLLSGMCHHYQALSIRNWSHIGSQTRFWPRVIICCQFNLLPEAAVLDNWVRCHSVMIKVKINDLPCPKLIQGCVSRPIALKHIWSRHTLRPNLIFMFLRAQFTMTENCFGLWWWLCELLHMLQLYSLLGHGYDFCTKCLKWILHKDLICCLIQSILDK